MCRLCGQGFNSKTMLEEHVVKNSLRRISVIIMKSLACNYSNYFPCRIFVTCVAYFLQFCILSNVKDLAYFSLVVSFYAHQEIEVAVLIKQF